MQGTYERLLRVGSDRSYRDATVHQRVRRHRLQIWL